MIGLKVAVQMVMHGRICVTCVARVLVLHPHHDLYSTSSASELLDAVRKRFGLHCFLLSINSLDDAHAHTAVNGITDLYAQCLSSSVEISPSLPQSSPHYACHLSTDDVKNIRRLVAEFTVQSLVPHMDRQVQLWNEQVASPRRGITGRLFQASKRYFGSTGGKQASSVRQIVVSSGAAGGSGAVNGSVSVTPTSSSATSSRTITVYPAGSPEALMRKLADFAFLLQDYTFAVAIYDSVKKDFQSDRAYKYYAAVQVCLCRCFH